MPTEIADIHFFWSTELGQWVVYAGVPGGQLRGLGISIDLAINNLRKRAASRGIKVLPEPILHAAPPERVAELEKYFKNKMATMRI